MKADASQALQVDLATETEMVDFGRALATQMSPGTSLYLRGELGAGKTTLTRGIARGLGHEGAVKSPTYTLVEPYLELQKPLYHFDLYRLGDPEELEYMGIRDYFGVDALVVVEWPERGGDFLPPPDLDIRLSVTTSGRSLCIEPHSDSGVSCTERLRSQWGQKASAMV